MRAKAALLALALLAAGAAQATETVSVRAGAHKGFGRMVFDAASPISSEAKIEGERLIVSFPRPIAADYAAVRNHLDGYLGPAAPAADGRSVAFPLLRPVSVRTATIDGNAVIDLHDKKAEAAKPVETVGVRTGEHDGFTRIVFDWRADVPYKVDWRDGAAVVTFGRAAAIDAAVLQRRTPPFVAGFAARREQGKTIAELRLAPGARVRHFRDGPRVAVDILAPNPKAKAAAPAKTAKAAPTPPKADKPQPAPEPRAEAKAEPRAEAKPEPKVEAKAGPAPDPKAPRVSLAQEGATARLDFAWPQPTPAAAFVRAGHLWLVFGARAELDLRPLKAGQGPVLAAEQIANSRGAALRLRLREGLAPSLRRDGGVWSVRLGPATPPTSAVTAEAQPAATPKPRVLIAAAEPAAPIELIDPEVGDRLIVAPTLAGGQGAPAPQRFVDFDLLPSAQGVVLRPRRPGLEVAPVSGGVAVTSVQGLALSAPPARDAGPRREAVAAALERPLLDLAAWSRPEKRSFIEARQILQRAVAQAPKAARNVARWELAKFLFANGLAPEALAELALIQEGDPNAARDPIFRAVRGAALLLAGRSAEAVAELSQGELDRYADVALWRGAALAAERRWEDANRQFAAAAAGLQTIPEKLREGLLLAWAKTALEANDLAKAEAALGMARELPGSPALDAQLALLAGRLAERQGEPDVALEQYAAAAASEYRPVRGRAELAAVELKLKRKEIDIDEASEALERLRFAWRGDEFEVELMRRLAELRFEKLDYAGGLDLLRQAVTYFPNAPEAKTLAQTMSRVFSELFQDGKADALSPVNALALYYEFKELTPAGPAGDAMIQKLADRLVGVDLLEQAAKLLDHQVTYRLRGPEQARVGARLAVIQLLDKQPQKALASLEKSRAPNLDSALEAERRQLAARAYADLGQSVQALQLLEGDDSQAAELLRADVHWRAKQWTEAARALRALLAAQEGDAQALSELEQAQVLKLAVALYMGNDGAGLDALRRRFGARMAKGKHAESFRLLTAEIDPGKIEFRKLAGAIAQIDELEAFMAKYRTRLAQQSLSAIN